MPMPNPKLLDLVEKMLAGGDPVALILEGERARGFRIIRPGDAPWFRAGDWRPASIASVDGMYARLVLLHAFESDRGAFTRTVEGIRAAHLIPTVIDPTREFAAMLKRRKWVENTHFPSHGSYEHVWSSP